MAFQGDKRYKEITFEAGKWQSSVGEHGIVTWTPSAPPCGFVVHLAAGGTQTHENCPPGTTVETTHGTAVINIP